MEKERDIRVELFRVEGDIAPFVMVDYVDKDAQEHSGLMLLDSGCNNNVFYSEMADKIGDLCKMQDEYTQIRTSTNVVISAENINLSFALDGTLFHERFCLLDEPGHENSVEMPPIIGILGLRFMMKHRLVIDYSDFSFHTSDVSHSNFSTYQCDFFFPMGIGMKYYDLPVLAFVQGDWELVALVDTGAECNAISSSVLFDKGIKSQMLEGTDTIYGMAGCLEVKEAEIEFGLLTLKDDYTEEIKRKDDFKIIPHVVNNPIEGICDDSGNHPDSIEVVIGSPFMAEEEWALDFGEMIIYKRKQTTSLREVV